MNTAFAAPVTSTAAPSNHGCPASAQAIREPNETTAASSIARRSPIRAASAPAGASARIWPTASIATTRPARPRDAPRSTARNAIIGVTAPIAISKQTDGR